MPPALDSRTLLKVARDYIEAHSDQSITLATAADLARFSPFHFHRLFAREFGETPGQFLQRLRFERAQRMLLMSDRSVSDICLEVGYESIGTFSARFRDRIGQSPSEFRESSRRIFAIDRPWSVGYIPGCFLRRYGAELRPQKSA